MLGAASIERPSDCVYSHARFHQCCRVSNTVGIRVVALTSPVALVSTVYSVKAYGMDGAAADLLWTCGLCIRRTSATFFVSGMAGRWSAGLVSILVSTFIANSCVLSRSIV